MADEDYVMPDFEVWAEKLVWSDRYEGLGNVERVILLEQLVAEALKNAFGQGKALGYRQGYNDGVEHGWWHAQEKTGGYDA